MENKDIGTKGQKWGRDNYREKNGTDRTGMKI